MLSAAICVPLCQAIISCFFQIGFLSGLSILSPVLALCFALACVIRIWKQRDAVTKDCRELISFIRSEALICALLIPPLAYGFTQVLFLNPSNHDALVYHLPRVFLFIQQDTFFLSAFSRYHQAIFPLAADILFLPFIQLNTLLGPGIFSLTSYLSIGASAYALARRHTSKRVAASVAFLALSLPMPVLQSVSVKNDLLMAAAGASALLLALSSATPKSAFRLFIFVLLCSFGVGCKTTFIAFLPGLAVVLAIQWKLPCKETIHGLLSELRRHWRAAICVAFAVGILSQVWLFIWNTQQYESWSGPEIFTERHQQHDGLKGAAANAARYGLQILQAGPWTDRALTHSLGTDPFSEQLNRFYGNFIQPVFKDAGANREPFEITWRLHEDWTWFGPFGALIIFVLLPIALIRKPCAGIELLPAMIYFCILCLMVSWMPWNGRFFTIFFVCLTPAIAVAIQKLHPAGLRLILILAACSMLSTKVFDFSRPLIPVDPVLYGEDPKSFANALRELSMEGNAWSKAAREAPLHKGNPKSLLSDLSAGSSVGLFVNGHFRHYGFYGARSDLKWYPINYLRGSPPLDLAAAWELFVSSEMDYMLCAGIYSTDLDTFLIKESADGAAHLLRNPSRPAKHSLGIDP